MRLLMATTVAAPLILSMSPPAAAQSFLDNLARRAADRVAAAAGDAPTTRRAAGERDLPRAPVTGPASWPLNADDAIHTGDLEFAPADEARAKGLDEFAKVECGECEGGYAYDSWITYHTDFDVDGVAAHVGRLAVGETLSWTGNKAVGVLEVVSEAPVGPFPCKQVRFVMTRAEATYETRGSAASARATPSRIRCGWR